MDATIIRRATAAAQTILRESRPDLIIDGKPGEFTISAYRSAPQEQREAVDSVMIALGVRGSMAAANDFYRAGVSASAKVSNASSSKRFVFDLQIVPAVTREARRRGLNPVYFVTHLVLESGYGEKTPLTSDGGPSFNYAGIKWKSVQTKRWADAPTREFVNGKSVSIVDRFAVFESPEEFAKAFFNYLFDGRSSYRYAGLDKVSSAEQYGAVLQKGGYATDPLYAKKFAQISDDVARRYALA